MGLCLVSWLVGCVVLLFKLSSKIHPQSHPPAREEEVIFKPHYRDWAHTHRFKWREVALENVSYRNPAALDRPSRRLAPTRNLTPSPRNTQTLPYYPRPRLAGRPSLPAGCDNPRVANRRRRPSPPPAAASIPGLLPPDPGALSARSLALQPSHLWKGRPPSSGAPRRGSTGGAAAGTGPEAPADPGGRAWRQQVSRGPRPRTAFGARGRRAHSPAARRPLPGRGMDTREKAEWEGPAALPSYAETLAPLPQPTQNTVRLSINYAARCRLQGLPDVRWSHPRRRLPRLRPLRPGRSGREVAKDAGRRRLAHFLGERVKPLISIHSSAHYMCRGAHTSAAHMHQGSLIYFSGTEDGEHFFLPAILCY